MHAAHSSCTLDRLAASVVGEIAMDDNVPQGLRAIGER